MGASQRNRTELTEPDSPQNTNLQVKNLRATASPGRMTAIGVFLIFGAVMAVAGITLTIPGTLLDKLWPSTRARIEHERDFERSVSFCLLAVGLRLARVG